MIRFAYADPPYPGKARKYYRDHADFAGEVDHAELIELLEDEFPDGWALSTSAAALPEILPLCPEPKSRGSAGGGLRRQFRLLAWCKPLSQPGGAPAPSFGWEPIILRGGRGDAQLAYPRDWLVCSPELYTLRPKPDDYVTGAKPPGFCRWLFTCAGLRPDDELVDLFPGSNAVALEWERWQRTPQLLPSAADPRAAEVLSAGDVSELPPIGEKPPGRCLPHRRVAYET